MVVEDSERFTNLDEYNARDRDSDGFADGRSTDPLVADTDGDGFSDGGEIAAGTDPKDEGSIIEGIYVEVPERTGIEENFEFEGGWWWTDFSWDNIYVRVRTDAEVWDEITCEVGTYDILIES